MLNTLSNNTPRRVVIVGAGVAGLHLALLLRRQQIPVTLYSDRSAAEMAAGRLPNTVALFGTARARTQALGIHDWCVPAYDTVDMHIHVAGPQPLRFTGRPTAPLLFLDMRLYLPRLMAEFVKVGGELVIQDLGANEVVKLAETGQLVVVATGRNGLAHLFARVPAASPYTQPQRRLLAGLFHGIQPLAPQAMCFQIAPGQGEIFENRFTTLAGKVGGLLIEALPGSELATITTMSYGDDPAHFMATLLALLQRYAPLTAVRIDPATFAVTRPLDLLQGVITPTVRRAYADLDEQHCLLALGDSHVTQDPITGQGANTAIGSAWLLAELIVDAFNRGTAFDQAFGQRVDAALWSFLEPIAAWSNAMLQPPPPHGVELLVAASQHQSVADAFVNNFDAPARNWEIFASPTRMSAFLQEHGVVPHPYLDPQLVTAV